MNASDPRTIADASVAAGLERGVVHEVHEVQLFGAFSVQAPGGALVTPPGRKARALLACVLLSAGHELPRERLAALLWSQRGEDQARASLRQTLYELRPLTVGEAPLLRLDRSHVRLVAGNVRTDLDRLRDAARTPDARSLAAQVGDQPPVLLRDFDGIDPAFDEWLATLRVQRHDERRQIMLSVGLAAISDRLDVDGADGARHLAAALLAADPLDEAAARLAMAASHRRGDRDGVRVAHERLATALHQMLGVAPSAETLRLRQQLMAAPFDAVPAVAPAPQVEPPRPASPPSAPRPSGTLAPEPADPASGLVLPAPTLPAPALTTPTSRRHPAFRPSLVVAALLLLLGAATWRARQRLEAAPQRMLRVDALKVTAGDSAARALGLGLAAELARVIVGNGTVLVVADAPVDTGVPTRFDEGSTDAARSAEIVLTGEAQSSGGLLHANLRLIARQGGEILWSSSFTGSEAEIEPLREQMAGKIADVALCASGGGRNPTLEVLGPDTMRLFLGACEQKHGDWALSAKLLRQVVARHPDFAHAWAMLAAATAVSANRLPDASGTALQREAEDDATRALALDPTDGEAYFARALALPGVHHWLDRQAVLERGHAAEPDNAQLSSEFASHMAQVGRWQEAIAYGQRAIELDPFSPGKASELVKLLAFGGDVLDAQVLMREQRRRFPQSEWAARTELLVEAFVGDARRAARLLDDARGRVDMTALREAMWRALIAARQAPSTEHTEAAVAAVMRSASESMQSSVGMVVRLAALGRTDQAFALAESLSDRQVEAGDVSLLFWSIGAPLRADPRFMPLAARHGLADVWLKTDRWPDFCQDHSVRYDCRAEAQKALARRPRVP